MSRRARSLPLLGLAVALVAAVACSSSTDNRVEVVDGEASGGSTTSATAGPGTTIDYGEPALTDDVEVTTAGIGDVTWGMTVDEAQLAVGTALVRQDGGTETCWVVVPAEAPEGISFIVNEGEVERVDIAAAGIETPSGAGVGMTEAALQELFPDQLTAADTEGGRSFTFVPNDPGEAELRIVFETDGSVVTSYRAGRSPIVEAIGC
jgi:hypothetical protein